MGTFPFNKIIFGSAKLDGKDQNVSLEISIKPFELSLDDYNECVDTSIRLDGIKVPREPRSLEGREFNFPVNPEDGYIDGSIYFFAAHNPVDVTKLKFGNIVNGRLEVELETSWVLEYENTGFSNFNTTFRVEIEL